MYPVLHGLHTADDWAWTKPEKVPATHPTQRWVLPSLYLPAPHATQAEVH